LNWFHAADHGYWRPQVCGRRYESVHTAVALSGVGKSYGFSVWRHIGGL
jgi:hypothetical protein